MSAENLLKKFTHPIERFIILNKGTIFFKKIYSLNAISFIENKKFVSIDEFYNDYFSSYKDFEAYICNNDKFYGENVRYFDKQTLKETIKYNKLYLKRSLGKNLKIMISDL